MTADEILFREELQTKSREELIETACRLMGELRAAQIRLDETSRGITEMSLPFPEGGKRAPDCKVHTQDKGCLRTQH